MENEINDKWKINISLNYDKMTCGKLNERRTCGKIILIYQGRLKQ